MTRRQQLIGLYMNRSIRVKILACMLVISLLAIFVSYYLFYTVSFREQVQQATNTAEIRVAAASTAISDSLTTLFTNIVSFMEKPEVVSLFERAQAGAPITANSLSDCMGSLVVLANTSSLVDAIMLITPDCDYISSRNVRLHPEHLQPDVWSDYGEGLITWLSARQTPYLAQDKDVIPLCFSFGYSKGFQTYIPRLVDRDDPFVFRMFIFFDYRKLSSFLQSNENDELSVTYLVQSDMKPISLTDQSPFYDAATSQSFQEQALLVDAHEQIRVGKQSYLVCIGNTMFSGLRVVNLTSRENLFLAHTKIANTISLAAVITIFAAVLLSTAMTRQLTRPLLKLVDSVRGIGGDGSSKAPFIPRYSDEIGELGTAVAHMRSTIDAQMDTIKEEERRRANAEIRMLTQQINPHFIYNTLDCIRWEILQKNIEGSSAMVESLATFLRLGFGHIGEAISIREEVTRVEQYLNIMRQRLDGSIFFFSYIDPKLSDLQIPRMILQPLVENSIKHGFSSDVFRSEGQSREIYIRCIPLPDGGFSLAVEDNGIGIDIERAQKSINLSEEDPSFDNIGLRNGYLRMRAYFGAEHVGMQFSSTPFFLNRVEYVVTSQEAQR